ncbi:MAG: hypothetical protein OEY79_01780, partial [Anaplasmataceae bacterium]|nr:hypothetical protein [Anaplasmataceae bacterium]
MTSITPIQKLLQNNFEKVTRKHEGVDTLFFQITTSNGNVFYIKPEGYFHTTTLADSSLLFNVFIEDTSGNLVKTRKLIPDKGTEGLEKNQFYSLALANQQAGTYELEALEKLLQSGHSSPGITAIQSMQEVKCVTFGAARDNIAPQTIDESHDYDIYSKLLVKQSNDSSGHYYGMRFQKNEGKYHIKFTTQTKVVNTENIEELNKIKNNIIENLFLTPAKKNELEAQIASISKEAEKLRVEKRELESALESALESEKGNLSSDQKKKLSELTSTLSPLDKLLSQAQQNLAQKFILSEKEQGEFKKLTIDAQDVKAGFLDNAAIGLAPSCGESAILSAQTEGAGISQTTELEIDDIIALRLIEIFNQDGALIDLTDGEYDKTINALSKKNEKLKNATLFPTGGGALPGFVCRVKCQENIQAELFKSLIPYKDITAAKAIFSREHGNPEIVQPTAMQFPVVATPPRQPRNTRQLTTDMEASIENFTAMIGSGALPTLIADGKITHTRQDDDIILKSKDNEHEYRYRKLTLIQKKAVINNI